VFNRSFDQSLSMIQLIVTHRSRVMNRLGDDQRRGGDQKDLQRSTVTCFDRRQRYTNAFCLLIFSWPTHFPSVLHHRVPFLLPLFAFSSRVLPPSAFCTSSFPFGPLSILRLTLRVHTLIFFLSRHRLA